jgi:hypothetical protein
MDTQWVSIFAAATLLGLYLRHVNRTLLSTPNEVQTISPNRFGKTTIIANYERLLKDPISVDLPPKTGRRYIVVGGAGFLPGMLTCTSMAILTACTSTIMVLTTRLDRGSTNISRGGSSAH